MYYLKLRIRYVDFLSFMSTICYVKVEFNDAQENMQYALHKAVMRFYLDHDSADIQSIEVIENKLYK